jgi:glycerophosphoryl diester phosphodiesterase
MLKIGHRGAKGHVAENTLASIRKAFEYQIDGVEFDVHKCASGELVVFHDFTLDRMTNGTGEVSKQPLKTLKTLKVNHVFTMPTIEEVFDYLVDPVFLNIELKGKETADETVRIISKYVKAKAWNYNNFLVSSFQHNELEKVFRLNTNIPLAVLTKANMDEAIAFAKTIKATAIHPNVALVTRNNVARVKKLGYAVNVWTVNEPAAIRRMYDYGVNGIISDFPDRL